MRLILQDERIDSTDTLQENLTEKSKKSRNTKLWVSVLINPLLLALRFIRTEREGHLLLHLDAAESILPLFYAAGYDSCTRDGLYSLNSMQSLLDHFLRG